MTRLASTLILCALLLSLSACGPAIKGGQALRAGEYKQAIGLFQQALEENPGDLWTRRQLGRAYLLDGQYDLAGIQFGAILATNPGDWESGYYLAVAHIGQGRRDQGIQEINDLIIPFAYYQKLELVRAAANYGNRTDMSMAEIAKAMDVALETSKGNQERREAGDKNNQTRN